MTEPTPEEIAAAIQEVAEEWAIFKEMKIFQRIMDAAVEREALASDALINAGTVENVVKLRNEIILARDQLEWYGNMDQVYDQYIEPEKYEPEGGEQFDD